jgi:hypothetical protein
MANTGVRICSTDDEVTVAVNGQTFRFEYPGMLSGSDLRDVLEACGIQAEYIYDEGDDCEGEEPLDQEADQ